MAENTLVEFTISELVRGWDDLRPLLRLADPDEVWEVVSSWPTRRLAAALVAAVTVMPPDEAIADQHWPAGVDTAAAGQRSPVNGDGQVSGHVASAGRPR